MVSDEPWEAIEPLLPRRPPRPKGGRPWVSDRVALGGIIFVLQTGPCLPSPNRMLNNFLLSRLLKKVQMEGGARCEARGVLRPYVAAPRERANAADGPFSAAC